MSRLFGKKECFQKIQKKWIFDKLNRNTNTCTAFKNSCKFPIQDNLEAILRALAPYGINFNNTYYSYAQNKISTAEKNSVKSTIITSQNYFQRRKVLNDGRWVKTIRNIFTPLLRNEVHIHGANSLKGRDVYKNGVRLYCTGSDDTINDKDDADDEHDAENIINADHLLEDDEYNQCLKDFCSLTDIGHKVFIIQIDLRGSQRKDNASPAHLQLAENEALVHSIPRWSVVGSEIVKVKEEKSLRMMSTALNSVVDKIRSTPNVSAVVISRNTLFPDLRNLAHRLFKKPVFDRSFILIQVFKFQAQTKEAKLHLALAELPFLRYCMTHGFVPGEFGRPVKRFIRYPFAERERTLQSALRTLEKQQGMARNNRTRRQIPTIAVIGYTNCGKTTLIKALTGDEDMTPRNKLFATLDVTAHGGLLPNNMMVIYMDTVGFLTYLPSNLKGAFTATLEDTLHSDLIIHVRDVSHPDMLAQDLNVTQSIQNLVPKYKLDTMINVYNKVDRLEESECESVMGSVSDPNVLRVSAVTGEGMKQLRQEVQTRLLQNINFLQKTLKIPLQGDHLSWLYKQATVVSMETDDRDPECIIVNVYISNTNYQKFMARFGRKRAAAER